MFWFVRVGQRSSGPHCSTVLFSLGAYVFFLQQDLNVQPFGRPTDCSSLLNWTSCFYTVCFTGASEVHASLTNGRQHNRQTGCFTWVSCDILAFLFAKLVEYGYGVWCGVGWKFNLRNLAIQTPPRGQNHLLGSVINVSYSHWSELAVTKRYHGQWEI